MKRRRKILIFKLSLLFQTQLHAAENDLYVAQRIALTRSSGDLSKYPSHLSLQTSVAHTFHSLAPATNIDFAHEISLFYDSFKTRGENTLLFPLAPLAEARVLEPALSIETCLFSMSPLRLCLAGGLSLMHIQTTIQNYQMYVGLPAHARFVWTSLQSGWTLETGARYRAIRNRTEGFISQHQDISYFLGFGYLHSSL